jgi:aminocarboxymuconate-semialdehyde decarboxylase
VSGPAPGTDLHAHAVPADVLPALREAAPDLAPVLRRAGDRWALDYPSGHVLGGLATAMFEPPPRLEWMDRQGIDVQVLSLPPSQFFYDAPATAAAELVGLQNDALVGLAAESPDRFRVLASLPLQDAERSVAEIRRMAAVGSVAGVHLGTHVAGVDLDAPELAPVWEALTAADLPALVHPHAPVGGPRLRRHYLVNLCGNPMETTLAAAALLYGGVLQDNPALRVCLVHGGGFLPYQLGRFDHGWNARPELRTALADPPSSLVRRMFYDSVLHDPDALRFLVDRVGADRVCLGSDHPFDMGADSPVRAVRDALPPARADQVLLDSARLLLRAAPA